MSEPPNLQYPIGKCEHPETLTTEERSIAIDILAALPQQLATAIDGLNDAQLNTPYRPDGWTIRQLVHHIADSDLTAYSWMRLSLTEDWPTVFDYNPASLAELPDSALSPFISLQLLECLHQRWVTTLRAIPESDWATRGYIHPESGRCTLEQTLAMYAWHSRHHLAHILNYRNTTKPAPPQANLARLVY
ncbi:YfiT family bacillithiol transferase [Granulicella arctica]|uniref:Putative damage-inducible protein DinB n=1 Tax=Granulicella arctica TaxID=940613 RepID=A0A7Y9PK98_9BACT|nr:putative metal-dependent hydrolase [Granulicella arctica]NYF81284.1 putative damage-inducible protein DinB [Granulicella arctica]